MLVLGDKEQENGTVSVRDRKGKTTTMPLDEFISTLREEVSTKSREELI